MHLYIWTYTGTYVLVPCSSPCIVCVSVMCLDIQYTSIRYCQISTRSYGMVVQSYGMVEQYCRISTRSYDVVVRYCQVSMQHCKTVFHCCVQSSTTVRSSLDEGVFVHMYVYSMYFVGKLLYAIYVVCLVQEMVEFTTSCTYIRTYVRMYRGRLYYLHAYVYSMYVCMYTVHRLYNDV